MLSEQEFIRQIRQHQKIILKVCHLYADKPEDREDLFQEILLNAWKANSKYRREAKFTTWLYQIGLNTAISFLRKTKRKPSQEGLEEDLQLPDLTDDATEQQFVTLYQAIGQLDKIDKAVVMLYLDEYDYTAIGQLLGITPNYVAVKMNRIRQQLKQTVQQN
ncbi:sigma-70 family RNA polymerase sigma factor [Spirosoma sp. KCTC 42546]|uniref:RNA polymerase sigma factor n=1 Tax=Spirosoma sp. KCTC 42546 TaxID=2520506 RepID=UPI00115C214B|nr:sigma-70 family RNA polymerase sigma factor [Spirosoma sp. KCTC 42546]QDK77576.1 sigma-70 family RNA polymerase sigma factor [Spirosoma sp. KCTC 42546]